MGPCVKNSASTQHICVLKLISLWQTKININYKICMFLWFVTQEWDSFPRHNKCQYFQKISPCWEQEEARSACLPQPRTLHPPFPLDYSPQPPGCLVCTYLGSSVMYKHQFNSCPPYSVILEHFCALLLLSATTTLLVGPLLLLVLVLVLVGR